MAEIASMATSQGIMLPARLRIDQRRRKIPGKPTREYIVPVLELPDTNFGQLVAGGFIRTTAPALGAGDAPALGPGAAPRAASGPASPRAPRRPATRDRPPKSLRATGSGGRSRSRRRPWRPDRRRLAGRGEPAESPAAAPFTPEEIVEAVDRPSISGGCLWQLGRGRGKPAEPCTFAPDHESDHSWKDLAMREGGRVIRPVVEQIS